MQKEVTEGDVIRWWNRAGCRADNSQIEQSSAAHHHQGLRKNRRSDVLRSEDCTSDFPPPQHNSRADHSKRGRLKNSRQCRSSSHAQRRKGEEKLEPYGKQLRPFKINCMVWVKIFSKRNERARQKKRAQWKKTQYLIWVIWWYYSSIIVSIDCNDWTDAHLQFVH